MRPCRLQEALARLGAAIREVDAAIAEMRGEKDPLAVHIYIARREYWATDDNKSGKRRALRAQLSWRDACTLGFRGTLSEWERLMAA